MNREAGGRTSESPTHGEPTEHSTAFGELRVSTEGEVTFPIAIGHHRCVVDARM